MTESQRDMGEFTPEIAGETRGERIARFTGIVMLATLLSRVLGLAREVVIAAYFGASGQYDAFSIAYTIPHFLRQLLAEGALSTAFIPVFTYYLTKKSKEEAWKLANIVFSLLVIVLLIVLAVGILFAPLLVRGLTVANFKNDIEKLNLTISLTRIMFPFLGFISLAALTMGMLNSHQHFLWPAIAPIMLSITEIIFIVVLSPSLGNPIYAAALGVLVGGMGQWLIQVPSVVKRGFRFKFIPSLDHPGIKEILRLMGPVALGLAVTQLNILVDRKLASGLIEGSISAMQYATRLIQLPYGVFGIAISTVSLPLFAKQVAEDDISGLKDSLSEAIRLIFFILLPSAVGLMVLRYPLIRLIFQRHLFTPQDTAITAIALFYYSFGLFGYGTVHLLNRLFYALGDTKSPMIIGAFSVGLNIVLNLILIGPMKVGGLALATSVAGIVNMLILFWLAQHRLKGIGLRRIMFAILKMVLSSLALGLTAFLISTGLEALTDTSKLLFSMIQVATSLLGSVAVYVTVSIILKGEEIYQIIRLVKNKLHSLRARTS